MYVHEDTGKRTFGIKMTILYVTIMQGYSETWDVISYISVARRWHFGGRQLNYLHKLASCLNVAAIIYLWFMFSLFTRAGCVEFCVRVRFEYFHSVLNINMCTCILGRNNFKAYNTAFSPGELYLFPSISF
jgi:hypothetical protein